MGIFIHDSVVKGINYELEENIEGFIWLRLRAEHFGFLRDRFIACIYFPPQDTSYVPTMRQGIDYFETLNSEYVKYMNRGDVYLCGDFNARTGLLNDYENILLGEDEESLSDPKQQFIDDEMPGECDAQSLSSMYNLRYSKDSSINTHGRKLINFCKSTGVRILNGRCFDDMCIGAYTHYDQRGM